VTASELAARLRACSQPVVARVEQGRVMIDLRTVFPEQDDALAKALLKTIADREDPA
jgi:L-seryl-tRNA(Ser) seleniumtransferase